VTLLSAEFFADGLDSKYIGGVTHPVKDAEIIYAGAAIAIVDGEWQNVTATTGLEGRICRARETVDNTDDGKLLEGTFFEREGKWLAPFRNDGTAPITTTDMGDEVYFVDNQTVSVDDGLLTSLIARITDIRTQVLAHAAGTGTYHGSADGVVYTITVPTMAATVYTACGQLKTTGVAHAPKVTGGTPIHGGIDLATVGALSALVVPTTLEEARLFVEAFAGIFFGASGHTTRTTDSIHGAADATNVLTSTAAVAARSRAGRVWAFAPAHAFDTGTSIVWVEVY
jgi:hypothetical protein